MSKEMSPEHVSGDPLQQARENLTRELVTNEYNLTNIFSSMGTLESTLLSSQLSPEEVYTELGEKTGMALIKAEHANDQVGIEILTAKQKTLEDTKNAFITTITEAKNAPTNTENHAPMTQRKS